MLFMSLCCIFCGFWYLNQLILIFWQTLGHKKVQFCSHSLQKMSSSYRSQELKKAILSHYHNGFPYPQIVKMNWKWLKMIIKVLFYPFFIDFDLSFEHKFKINGKMVKIEPCWDLADNEFSDLHFSNILMFIQHVRQMKIRFWQIGGSGGGQWRL